MRSNWSPARYCAATLLAALSTAATAAGWGGSLGAATDLVSRGVTQSSGRASVQGDVHFYAPSGWLAGIWAGTLPQRTTHATTAELDAYLGYARSLSPDWSTKLALVRYNYLWDRRTEHYDYSELVGTAAWRHLAALTIAYSPNTSIDSVRGLVTDRAATSYDLSLQWPLLYGISLNAGVGYYDLRRLFGAGYAYGNSAVEYTRNRIQWQLSYVATSASAKTIFYSNTADDRWLASVLWRF